MMGHRNDDAIAALRAYARDLEAAAGGSSARAVGGPDQDDAPVASPGSGAPHQLAIAAVAVSVVLIGSIGIATALVRPDGRPTPTVASSASVDVPSQPTRTGDSSATAARAFYALGMPRAAHAVEDAIATGMDDDEGFTTALTNLRSVVAMYATSGRTFDESVDPLSSAVSTLEAAARPPGLDPSFVPPGLGGTPPGQDPEFTPPGQDPEFTPPGQDPEFTPPGQDDARVAPGNRQDKPPTRDEGTDE